MASIPQQYRAALQTWVTNNIHKAVHTDTYTEGVFTTEMVPGPDEGDVEVQVPVLDEEGVQLTIEHSYDFLDVHELALRLGRKIHKAAPELRGKFDLRDLEELLDDKLPQLLNLAGVTTTGSAGRKFSAYKDEDPDGVS